MDGCVSAFGEKAFVWEYIDYVHGMCDLGFGIMQRDGM